MLRLMFLESELVKIRSNVFPCLCVGVMIMCVRFLLYTACVAQRVRVICSSSKGGYPGH